MSTLWIVASAPLWLVAGILFFVGAAGVGVWAVRDAREDDTQLLLGSIMFLASSSIFLAIAAKIVA